MIDTDKYLCGKHKIIFDSPYPYHLHIIDEHDTEHGLWQPVGYHGLTIKNLKTGVVTPFFGNFRYLPMYDEKECRIKNHHLEALTIV